MSLRPVAVWSTYRDENPAWHARQSVDDPLLSAALSRYAPLAERLRQGSFRTAVLVFDGRAIVALRNARTEHMNRPHAEVELSWVPAPARADTIAALTALFAVWQRDDVGTDETVRSVATLTALIGGETVLATRAEAVGDCVAGLAVPLSVWIHHCSGGTGGAIMWAPEQARASLFTALAFPRALTVTLFADAEAAPSPLDEATIRLLELASRPSSGASNWSEAHASTLAQGLSASLIAGLATGAYSHDDVYKLAKVATSVAGSSDPGLHATAAGRVLAALRAATEAGRPLLADFWRRASRGASTAWTAQCARAENGGYELAIVTGPGGVAVVAAFADTRALVEGRGAHLAEFGWLRADMPGLDSIATSVRSFADAERAALSSKQLVSAGFELTSLSAVELIARVRAGDRMVMEAVRSRPGNFHATVVLVVACVTSLEADAATLTAALAAYNLPTLAGAFGTDDADSDGFATFRGEVKAYLLRRMASRPLAQRAATQRIALLALEWAKVGRFDAVALLQAAQVGVGAVLEGAGEGWAALAQHWEEKVRADPTLLTQAQHLELARMRPKSNLLSVVTRAFEQVSEEFAALMRARPPEAVGEGDWIAMQLELPPAPDGRENGQLIDKLLATELRPAIPAQRLVLKGLVSVLSKPLPDGVPASNEYEGLQIAYKSKVNPASLQLAERLVDLSSICGDAQYHGFHQHFAPGFYARRISGALDLGDLRRAMVHAKFLGVNFPHWKSQNRREVTELAFAILAGPEAEAGAYLKQLGWRLDDMLSLTGPAPLFLRDQPASEVYRTLEAALDTRADGLGRRLWRALPVPDGIPASFIPPRPRPGVRAVRSGAVRN